MLIFPYVSGNYYNYQNFGKHLTTSSIGWAMPQFVVFADFKVVTTSSTVITATKGTPLNGEVSGEAQQTTV